MFFIIVSIIISYSLTKKNNKINNIVVERYPNQLYNSNNDQRLAVNTIYGI